MLEDEREAADMNSSGAATNSISSEYSHVQEQAAKYEPHADKINASVLGDNLGTVNNYNYHNSPSLQEMKQFFELFLTILNGDGSPQRSSFMADQTDILMRLGENLQDVASANVDVSDYVPGQTNSTEMPSDIDEWFYKLDDYERYYVVAVALLQGVPATDVSLKARDLYQSCCFMTGSQSAVTLASMNGAIPSHSATRLRKRTYTILSQAGGVARLFWQNTEFGAQVLRFIAEESIEWPGSQPGQSFLDILQKWPEELAGECSRRSARALGGILAYQSTNQLWRVANAWANSESNRNWHLAALLLSGAYEVGCIEADRRVSSSITDSVLRLLKQWTERFVQSSNTRVACAAARTYSLLGRQSPEIALQGIEQLLQLPPRKTENALPDEIISAIVSAYVALTWSGHARLVLDALALHAEHWSHQHYLPVKEYQRYRQQREMVLNVTFDAFFLIAASSLAARGDDLSISYNAAGSLPEHPALPDRSGRDILLAGLLTRDEPCWYLDLSTLLCAAIIEKKNKAAFDLLRQWAETVLGQQGDETKTLYAVFVNFIVNLGRKLHEWCNDLEGRGLTRRSLETYRDRLIKWKNEGPTHQHPVSELAQDVLLLVDR
jgi:hypothetical protein